MSRVTVRKATRQEIARFEVTRQERQALDRADMTRSWMPLQSSEYDQVHNRILETFRWSPKQYGRYDTHKQRLNRS